jgi:hypothetical protein
MPSVYCEEMCVVDTGVRPISGFSEARFYPGGQIRLFETTANGIDTRHRRTLNTKSSVAVARIFASCSSTRPDRWVTSTATHRSRSTIPRNSLLRLEEHPEVGGDTAWLSHAVRWKWVSGSVAMWNNKVSRDDMAVLVHIMRCC